MGYFLLSELFLFVVFVFEKIFNEFIIIMQVIDVGFVEIDIIKQFQFFIKGLYFRIFMGKLVFIGFVQVFVIKFFLDSFDRKSKCDLIVVVDV